MLEMPEACPTSSGATDAVEADDAGPLANPSPTAMAISGATNAAYVQDAVTKPRTAKATAARPNPSATAELAPIFTARGVMRRGTAVLPAPRGRGAAGRGVGRRGGGSWKKGLRTSIGALTPPATSRIASVAPTSTGLRSS